MASHEHDSTGVPSSREPAPGDLAVLQRFVNTLDLEDRVEELDSAASARRWLAGQDLLAPNARMEESEVRRLRELREAFRALLHANNGAPVDPSAVDTVNAAGRAAKLVVEFGADSRTDLIPARGGADGAIARLLAIAHRAQVDGTWKRLKACPESTCSWAFYDRSRNRSSTWCSMAVCGNRAKARAFRERQRA